MMWYDALVLAVLVLAAVRGAMKGFVWQLASIAALILCFAFAEAFSVAVAPYIHVEQPLNRWIAMFALYVLFSFASFGVARLLRGWIEKAQFVEFDRHLGSLFGLLKGAVLALVLTFFAVTLSKTARAHVLESQSGYFAAIIMDRLHPVMPEELHAILEPYIHQLDRPGIDLHYAHHHDHHDGTEPEAAEVPAADADEGHLPQDAEGRGSAAAELEKLLADVPALQDEQLRQTVTEAWEQTSPEDQAALLELLRTSLPAAIRLVAGEWQADKPAEAAPASHRQSLLQQIAAVYADFPDAQAALAEEIEAALSGLPDSIVLGVLSDWKADLTLGDSDPDPQTNVATPLDTRILRQLARAGVPLESLSRGLRERLEAARSR